MLGVYDTLPFVIELSFPYCIMIILTNMFIDKSIHVSKNINKEGYSHNQTSNHVYGL